MNKLPAAAAKTRSGTDAAFQMGVNPREGTVNIRAVGSGRGRALTRPCRH